MFNTSSFNFPLNDLLYLFPQVLPGVMNNVLTFTALENVMLATTHDYKMLGVSDRIAWFSGGSLDKIQTKDHFKVLKGSIN